MRRLDNIDLRLLRIYTTLVEAGSFVDAVAVLNLSQPTLSTHLATLEQRLGERLCERGRRGFRLLPFGETTYKAAKQLFADIDAFNERVGTPTTHTMSRIRVGIVDGVVTNWRIGLQKAIGSFLEQGTVFVDLELATPMQLQKSLVEGQRDLVIGDMPNDNADGITYVPLQREAHALYCGKTHAFFDPPARKITRKLLDESLFSIRGYLKLDDVHRVGRGRASGSVNMIEAQTMMILSGRFIGFLPCHVGDHWAAQGEMKSLKLRAYTFEAQHFAAYRTADASNRTLMSFLDEVKRHAFE